MFTKIEFSNIGCYEDNVVLDFSVSKRDKTNVTSYTEIQGDECFSNIIGIIGGNAYGKSTILDMLNSIGSFINGPKSKKELLRISEDNRLSDEHKKYLEFIIKHSYILPRINNKHNGNATIKIDMYIDAEDEKYKGFYTYYLEYNKDYRSEGVVCERLEFRKKNKSAKIKTLFEVFNNLESEIGYKLAYKENIKNELNDSIDINEFEERMNYYQVFHEHYTNESATMDANDFDFDESDIIWQTKNNVKLLELFVKAVDNSIEKISIDDVDTKNPKLYAIDLDGYKIRYDYFSTATKKICLFVCDLIRSQKKNGIILIDELDNSFNLKITEMILKLFNRDSNNKAQLIFTTNNPEVMDKLRKDQIFIIQRKNGKVGCLKFSDYIDPKTNNIVRNDFSFVKAYKQNNLLNQPSEEKIDELMRYINQIY